MGKAYGKTCPPGGWIGVVFDMDNGMMNFIINGSVFTTATTHEHMQEGEYFPTIFFGGNKGQCL